MLASVVFVLCTLSYFGTDSESAISFLTSINPWVGVCGAIFGIATFVATKGRGYFRGLGHAVQQNPQTSD